MSVNVAVEAELTTQIHTGGAEVITFWLTDGKSCATRRDARLFTVPSGSPPICKCFNPIAKLFC